ncbi:MAG: rRNA maturation RNase YbeY [Ktedonobacteraceae bacterium]
MQEQYPQIELSINTGNDKQNAAIEHVLDSCGVELVVKNTLQAAGVTEPAILTLLITSDDAIRDLNRQYRQQDKATDVLSFPLLDKPLVNAPVDQLWMTPEGEEEEQAAQEGSRPVFITPPELPTNLGDIVISWPIVLRQASEAGHSPTYELLYLISHGVLHLIGYDDQSEAGYSAMVNIQQSVLEAMGQKA